MVIHASVEPLEWESTFFNIHSGIIHFSDSAAPLTVAQLTCWSRVQAKIDAADTARLSALQTLGFQVVEAEMDFVLSVALPPCGQSEPLPIAREHDIPALRTLAERLFTHSRFGTPWYAPGESGRFYGQWVENAVRGTFDDVCLLAYDATGLISGFVTLRRLPGNQARVGLLGGKGAGAVLMALAQGWCRQQKIAGLHVATQFGNLPALRRYVLSGAQPVGTAYWLYR